MIVLKGFSTVASIAVGRGRAELLTLLTVDLRVSLMIFDPAFQLYLLAEIRLLFDRIYCGFDSSSLIKETVAAHDYSFVDLIRLIIGFSILILVPRAEFRAQLHTGLATRLFPLSSLLVEPRTVLVLLLTESHHMLMKLLSVGLVVHRCRIVGF